MPKYFLRIAKEVDFDDVSKHLLVVGELKGDCFSCRQVGIDYVTEKPDAISGAQIKKLMSKRPDLTYVEYSDVKEIFDKQNAKNFFK